VKAGFISQNVVDQRSFVRMAMQFPDLKRSRSFVRLSNFSTSKPVLWLFIKAYCRIWNEGDSHVGCWAVQSGRIADVSEVRTASIIRSIPNYTVQHPRRKSSSYSPPWEHDVTKETWNVCIKQLCVQL